MAEIAVINKDNTDYDIRDKKLADHTSASTDTSKVSSASSIMLEASDGSFVSVKRDSFVNAIRDVLGSSIVANTGGTSDVNTIPALTSSGGLKSVSTADIASVLGEEGSRYLFYRGANSYEDLNNINFGAFICYSSNPNTPVDNSYHAFVIAFSITNDHSYTIQLASVYNGSYRIRTKFNGVWTAWTNI